MSRASKRKKYVYEPQRRKARAYLRLLVHKQARKCFWCDRWLAMQSDQRGRTIIEKNVREIAWLNNGVALRAGHATIDHVLPLSKGGTSALENLVAACWECNQDRGRMNSLPPEEQSRRDVQRERDRRRLIIGDPEYIAWREKVEARRAAKAKFCKHGSFDSVAEAVEFRDKAQRALRVRILFWQCLKCKKWRVGLMTSQPKGTRRMFAELLEKEGAVKAPDYIN